MSKKVIFFILSIALVVLVGVVSAQPDRVVICHKGATTSVPAPAVPGHLGHGDTLGPCGTIPPQPTATPVPQPPVFTHSIYIPVVLAQCEYGNLWYYCYSFRASLGD